MMNSHSIVLLFATTCSLSLSLGLLCHSFVWWSLRRRKPSPETHEAVTILKPLCGAEPQLAENLSCLAAEGHANLQLILGTATGDDAALPIVRRFCKENLQLETRQVVGYEPGLLNRKVALLDRMSRHARGQWLIVSDANVRIPPKYIQDTLALAAPDVGLITHLVAGAGDGSLGAHLENLQLNCLIAPGMCGARLLANRTCVVGKSMFLRADVLNKIGGFRSAGWYLAEDYQIGRAVEKAGYRVVVAPFPITSWHGDWSLQKFFSRHLRWSVMRRKISPLGYCLEVLLNPGPFFLGLLALALWGPGSPLDARFACLGFVTSQVLVAVTSWKLGGASSVPMALLLNPFRECLAILLWLGGWCVAHVQWRGRSYWVGPGTRLSVNLETAMSEVGDEA